MLVHEIVNTKFVPLATTDTVGLALLKMDLLKATHYPVVKDGKLIGMASLTRLIEASEEAMTLDMVTLDEPIFLPHHQHLFEAARKMLALELFVLPIVDEEMNYLGLINKREVLEALGDIFNLSAFGSVISIEVFQCDYTLTDIVRIVETEGAKILGIAVQQPNAENNTYRISLKLNLADSSVVSSSLRRFGYVITSEVSSNTFEHDFSERADELIRYLDI